jgi:hypothetical protein
MKIQRILILLLGILLAHTAWSQQAPGYRAGSFGLGIRTTGNYFLDNDLFGLGAGGQFKIGFSPRVNTEWFLDYIQSSNQNNGFRRDYHIGWSVQFALPKDGFGSRRVTPYVLGGQCFDLTEVGYSGHFKSPLIFSAAAQVGAGISTFIQPRLELNVQAQYMVHLSKDVHLEEHPEENGYHYHIEPGLNFQGHLLLNASLNFYFLQLWNR